MTTMITTYCSHCGSISPAHRKNCPAIVPVAGLESQYHIPPALLDALVKYIDERAYHGGYGGDWNAVLVANRKETNER